MLLFCMSWHPKIHCHVKTLYSVWICQSLATKSNIYKIRLGVSELQSGVPWQALDQPCLLLLCQTNLALIWHCRHYCSLGGPRLCYSPETLSFSSFLFYLVYHFISCSCPLNLVLSISFLFLLFHFLSHLFRSSLSYLLFLSLHLFFLFLSNSFSLFQALSLSF